MKNKILLSFFSIFFIFNIQGQDFEKITKLQLKEPSLFFKHYGKKFNEIGYDVKQTKDGGYILIGSCDGVSILPGSKNDFFFTNGGTDILVIKLNSEGKVEWSKHYGGPRDECAYSVVQLEDGRFVIAGFTSSYDYRYKDIAIYKLETNGNLLWSRHLGGKYNEEAYCIQKTYDDGFIVTGYTETNTKGFSDIVIYKLNRKGYEVWSRKMGGKRRDVGKFITQLEDKSFILLGYSESQAVFALRDIVLYKLNETGETIWKKRIGGKYTLTPYSLVPTQDNGFIISASKESSNSLGFRVGILIKVDSFGNIQWTKEVGGSGSDFIFDVCSTTDNNFIAVGKTNSFSYGNFDVFLVKLDTFGNQVWKKHFGDVGDEEGLSIEPTNDGGFIITGSTTSYPYSNKDILLMKINSQGEYK